MVTVADEQRNKVSEAERQLIDRLQSNLATVRKVSGLTSQELADEVGLSRQSINSLEHGKTKMSKTQYLALRSVFNYRAADDQALAMIIKTLIDDPVVELDELVEATNAATGKRDRKDELAKALIPSAIVGASALTAALANPAVKSIAASGATLVETVLKSILGKGK